MVEKKARVKTGRSAGAVKKSASAARGGRIPARNAPAKRPNAGAPARNASAVLERLRLAGLTNELLNSRRQDLEALIAANKKSFSGLQQLVNRRIKQLSDAAGEWKLVVKAMKAIGPSESVGKLDELAKGAFRMALENTRDLAELAARSQAEAVQIVSRRIGESIDRAARKLDRR